MGTTYRVCGVQLDVELGEPEKNLQTLEDFTRRARGEGAHLTVFPECAVTGYCFKSLDEAMPYAEPIPGPGTQRVAQLCHEIGGFVIYGLLERDGDRLFNACVLVGPDGVIGSYRKVHLPFLGVDRFTTPGDRPFAVHAAGELRVGMQICYDGAFPEGSRILALEGADLLVLPTNWPPGAEGFSEFLVNARAMENHVYFLAVNRVGRERGFRFIGASKACDPTGKALDTANDDETKMLWVEVDVEWARNKQIIRVERSHEINRFADRRPDLYGRISQPL